LRGFKLALKQDPSLELVLVGDGPLRQRLKKLAKNLSIDHRTKFMGSRGRTEIAQLLHGCLVFVLPSILEPFGIAIIEAMACKKVVVATSVGGIPEIIENGKNGFLVPPKDEHKLAQAIMLVLRDNVLRKSIEEEAYETVRQRFTYSHTGGKYEELYDRLLAA
jgi:glycosyltransferase involved in cell wall biosynthesis